MSISTCVGIIVGSLFIAGGLSDLGNSGRPRNKYADYVDAMEHVAKMEQKDMSYEMFIRLQHELLDDIRMDFCNKPFDKSRLKLEEM